MILDKTEAERAQAILQAAVRKGILIRPKVCELCDDEPAPTSSRWGGVRPNIGGHHWKGYDEPLEVWWICAPCNRKLGSRHDGSLTKEQARRFVWAYDRLGPKEFDKFVGVRTHRFGVPE